MSTDLDPKEEKAKQKELTEQFKPLLTWLKEQAQDVVRDGKYGKNSLGAEP